MDTVAKLCTLLEEKKRLFLSYEKATQGLLGCDADSAEQYIIERERLAIEIDAKNEEIAREASEMPAPALVRGAAGASIDFEKVPGEYHCVFYAGQAVRSVISRVIESDRQATEHLEKLRGLALENVKQNKEIPRIKRYISDLAAPPQTGGLRDKKV